MSQTRKFMTILIVMIISLTAFTGCDKDVIITTGLSDDVIFKLSDSEVKLSEIILLLVNEKNIYEKDFGAEIWEQTVGDINMADSVKGTVKNRMVYLEAVSMYADKNGVVISGEEESHIEEAAKEYFDSLSDEEKKLMNITKDDVYNFYRKNYFADKVYSELTSQIEYEVSDEEARVMDVMYIYIAKNTEDTNLSKVKAEQAMAAINAGEAFYSVAKEYSDDEIIRMEICRGNMIEKVEEVAFKLAQDECTGIVEIDNGYYIVKCLDDYLETETQNNKETILESMKNEAFLKDFNPYLESLKLDFNSKIWDSIDVLKYEKADTDSLYEVYSKYIQ